MKTIEIDGDYLMITLWYRLVEKNYLDANLEMYAANCPDISPKDVKIYKLRKVDEISKVESMVNHDDYLIIAPATDFGSHRKLSKKGDFFDEDLKAFLRNHSEVSRENVTVFRLQKINYA